MKVNKEVMAPVKKITSLIKSDDNTHIWQFSRIGGENRVNLQSGSDLEALAMLDQKLWTALSCPVHGMEIDSRTLELIDTDNDQRIRVPEILAAMQWLLALTNNHDDLLQANQVMPLSAINVSTEEGKAILASAKQILFNLGKAEQQEISVAEASATEQILSNSLFNGDGIILESATEDEGLKQMIGQILAISGSIADRNGQSGITGDLLTDFLSKCADYDQWYARSESESETLLPFGTETAAAYAAYQAIQSKINDYFLRGHLASFDQATSGQWNQFAAQAEALSPNNLAECAEAIAAFPIAMGYAAAMPLTQGINPAWKKQLENFRTLVLTPLFPGQEQLTQEAWDSIPARFAGYLAWQAEKKGAEVEHLGIALVREYLNGSHEASLRSLIEQDKAVEKEINDIGLVEKLTRYYCDFYTLLRNFVTFSDFYSNEHKAMFQAGRLFIDQRCCELCIRVSDMPKHNSMAGYSGICLVYCDCVSQLKNERMTIVAALTDGDIDNIMVGRNAIFYDREGNDWDATLIKIIDNPISIRQAFWSPYKKLSRMISRQIEKVASSKEKAVESSAATGVEKSSAHVEEGVHRSMQTAPAQAAAPAAPPFDIGKFVGIFAAISLALGAIGTVIMSILTGFLKLTWWQMPLAIIGIILAISLPSMVIAYLKLRKRDLAPVLDANGWAINARITVN
ncbi:MAG: hypothetical protein LWW85_15580, partial [Marinilabiliales bacterium]|nr:hypothetical protein [Marinilabiliales bacterium]